MNWSVISALLMLVSVLVGPRTVRFVDIAGAQALARVPLLFAALANVPFRDGNLELASAIGEGRLVMPAPAILAVGAFGSACTIWMIWLMWKAFAVSLNQRGGRAVAIFVGAVIVGIVATEFLLAWTLGGLAAAGLPGGS